MFSCCAALVSACPTAAQLSRDDSHLSHVHASSLALQRLLRVTRNVPMFEKLPEHLFGRLSELLLVSVPRPSAAARCIPLVQRAWLFATAVYLSFGAIVQYFTVSMTEACARRPGAAASVSRRRRERRTLLAGGGRRASRSHYACGKPGL